MNKYQKDIEMFGSNNEIGYILTNLLFWFTVAIVILGWGVAELIK